MNSATVLLVVAVTIAVDLLLVGAALVALALSRRWSRARARAERPQAADLEATLVAGGLAALEPSAFAGGEPTYDRVFRIASWAFLLTVAVAVAAGGMWQAILPEIVILVAVTGGFVLLIHDVLPAVAPRSVRGVLLVGVALGFAALLVFLTGGHGSPFVFTFPLIAGGAAIAVGPFPALVIAVVTTSAYLLAATAGSGFPEDVQIAAVAVNLAALLLLTYVGAAVGQEQERARRAALRLSSLDSLTGLYNRPFFFAALEGEIARSERTGRGFCVLMLDVDVLKEINDRHGHHAGDAVLRAVAETVKSRIRKIDVAARYGGDEFAALLPETDPSGGWVVAEKIRLGAKDQEVPGLALRPTVSVGVVAYPTDGQTADGLMVSADRAMYVSKRGGRDRVAAAVSEPTVVHTDPERPGRPDERAG